MLAVRRGLLLSSFRIYRYEPAGGQLAGTQLAAGVCIPPRSRLGRWLCLSPAGSRRLSVARATPAQGPCAPPSKGPIKLHACDLCGSHISPYLPHFGLSWITHQESIDSLKFFSMGGGASGAVHTETVHTWRLTIEPS